MSLIRAKTVLAILVASSTSTFAAGWSEINTGLPSTYFGLRALVIDPAKPSTLYVLTSAEAIFKSTDAGGSWKSLNGIAGASSLSIDPKNSALYAIRRGGVVKSLDGGESWKAARAGLTGDTISLAISASEPSTLYALTSEGVFKSADAGENWNATRSDSSRTIGLHSLVIDTQDPFTLYSPHSSRGMVKSTDGGESWNAIKPAPSSDYSISCIAVDPLNSSTIYAGFVDNSLTRPGESPTGGVLKSTDGGKTWNPHQDGIPSTFFVTALSIDPTTPSTLYAVVISYKGGGVLKSTDGGQSWKGIHDGLPSDFQGLLAIDPGSSSTIYAGSSAIGGGALFKSTQGGESWRPASAGLSAVDARVLTIGPADGMVYAGVRDGVFKSLNDGESWTNLKSFRISGRTIPPGGYQPPVDARPAVVRSLLIDFKNPNILYVETTGANGCSYNDKVIFKSTDAGASWDDSISPLDSGCVLGGLFAHATVMAMDPVDPNTLYLGETEDENGFFALLKSGDGGEHWTSVWGANNGLQSSLNTVAMDPGNPGTLYAGVGDAFSAAPWTAATGVSKSTDGGTTWNFTGLKDTAATVLVIDRADPSILYAGTQGIYTEPRGFRGLFKSRDGAASWEAVSDGLSELTDIGATITAMVIEPNHSNVLYAGTSGGGVYKSIDGAASWVKFNEGLTNLEIRALVIAPGSTTNLYAATSNGIFRILDETPTP